MEIRKISCENLNDEAVLLMWKKEVEQQRQPVIFEKLKMGSCLEKWTSIEYLQQKCDGKHVKIHVSPTPQMDFLCKNFLYKSLPFSEFVLRASAEMQENYFISKDEKYYLRSLGENTRKSVADISRDFPDLAGDIDFPTFVSKERIFSTIFRIGSKNIQLWTHYDIMDNVLMQVVGKKRVVLFPPSEAQFLYMKGDKSEVLDIDGPDLESFPLFRRAKRFECILQQGDTLFIPALWFHNIISLSFGIAVNVFWKHLDDNYYDSKDLYGNKDLLAYSQAAQIVERAIAAIKKLPEPYDKFYAQRLSEHISKSFELDSSQIDLNESRQTCG